MKNEEVIWTRHLLKYLYKSGERAPQYFWSFFVVLIVEVGFITQGLLIYIFGGQNRRYTMFQNAR